MSQRATRTPIENEANNGLKNDAGTIAMARTPDPHSASAQFFINTAHNSFLDWWDRSTPSKHPVFGRVTEGMDIIKAIEGVGSRSGQTSEPVKMNSITIVEG